MAAFLISNICRDLFSTSESSPMISSSTSSPMEEEASESLLIPEPQEGAGFAHVTQESADIDDSLGEIPLRAINEDDCCLTLLKDCDEAHEELSKSSNRAHEELPEGSDGAHKELSKGSGEVHEELPKDSRENDEKLARYDFVTKVQVDIFTGDNEKPRLSVTRLATEAIQDSEEQRLTKEDIVISIIKRYPYYKKNTQQLEATLGMQLKKRNCFTTKRIVKESGETECVFFVASLAEPSTTMCTRRMQSILLEQASDKKEREEALRKTMERSTRGL